LVGNTNRPLPSSTQHTGRALSSNAVDHSITKIRVTDTVASRSHDRETTVWTRGTQTNNGIAWSC
jgi:hypothetical protein